MKINRHIPWLRCRGKDRPSRGMGHRGRLGVPRIQAWIVGWIVLGLLAPLSAQQPQTVFEEASTAVGSGQATAIDALTPDLGGHPTNASIDQASESEPSPATSQPQAALLLDRVIKHLVGGPAFTAMIRETVHVSRRDVVGVGSYEQSGGGTGCYHLQLTMHDGHGKHSLRQICDGRLAWTRNEIAGSVSLRRVDVGRLDEWIPAQSHVLGLPPRVFVGGWSEMLMTLRRDYSLKLGTSNLSGQKVLVITGLLRPTLRDEVLRKSGRSSWPSLYPTEIRVAIATSPDPKTGFGKWLPVRMEFRGDRVQTQTEEGIKISKNGPLVTLIEIYSPRQIQVPPAARYRFENQNAEIDIANETDRYMQSYGIRLTAKEKRSLRR